MVTHIILLTFMLVVIVVSVAPGIKDKSVTFKNAFHIFTIFTYIVLSS